MLTRVNEATENEVIQAEMIVHMHAQQKQLLQQHQPDKEIEATLR